MSARTRALAIVGSLVVSLFFAGSMSMCVDATEIVLDVRADFDLCNPNLPSHIRRTGIAVTTPGRMDTEPLEMFEGAGCEAPGDRIGTLTITPSGGKDEEVGIRVVAGVEKPLETCSAATSPPYDGCIVARRRERFEPGRSKKVIVVLRRACIGKFCGALECDPDGKCVPPDQILDDGGTTTDSSSSGDGAIDAPNDAGGDAIPDAGADANPCNGCRGTCNATTCTVDCNQVDCENPNNPPCTHGLNCQLHCNNGGNCNGAVCASDGGCTFLCKATNACQNITCNATSCTIDCQAQDSCVNVDMSGGDAGMTCRLGVNDACDSNGAARCDAGRCALVCDNQGQNSNCPGTRICASGSSCSGYPND